MTEHLYRRSEDRAWDELLAPAGYDGKSRPLAIAPAEQKPVPVPNEPKPPERPPLALGPAGFGMGTVMNPEKRDVILRIVARVFGTTKDELLSQRRPASISASRQAGYLMFKEFTLWSLPQIGRVFTGRDHTTIMHGYRRAIERATFDEDYRSMLEQCRHQIQMALFPKDGDGRESA